MSSSTALVDAANGNNSTKTNHDIDDDDRSSITLHRHLAWTKKQGWILSGGGQAERLYNAERGFPFDQSELPHTNLLAGTTHDVFMEWKKHDQRQQQQQNEKKNDNMPSLSSISRSNTIVAGAWERPLFVGGYQHSSSHDEETYNLQSGNLFIDLRIPRTRSTVLNDAHTRGVTSLEDLTSEELRLYARQHVFGGYTRIATEVREQQRPPVPMPVATRHHAIDWNFVGTGRPRPNKWWINLDDQSNQTTTSSSNNFPVGRWEELAYATDDWCRPYYFERWERYDDGGPLPRLALRKCKSPSARKRKAEADDAVDLGEEQQQQQCNDLNDDGIIVIIGDHFNYLFPRKLKTEDEERRIQEYPNATSLVDLVDSAVQNNDLDTARSYLSIEAGHGRVSVSASSSADGKSVTSKKKKRWILDCTIPFWNKGKQLWDPYNGDIQVIITDSDDNVGSNNDVTTMCKIMWKNEIWDIYDCSFNTPQDLKDYLFSS